MWHLVSGSIVKKITKFAIPCILIRIIQNLYPLLDSLIVGKILDLDSLSAVGVAGSLYSLFNDTLIGLVSGFAIVLSKKFGSETKRGVTNVFYTSLFASIILCVIVSVSGILFSEQMLLALHTPAPLMRHAKDYLFVLLLGLVPNMLYNFISEMLRAVGNSKTPLLLLIVSSCIHLVLLYPSTKWLGIRGTALTTAVSYVVTVIIGAIYIRKKVPQFGISAQTPRLDLGVLKECFHIGVPMALTNLVVMLGVLMLSFVSNNIGTEYVAAYSCASKIGYIITTPIFGFATALAVFTSQNFGAGNFERIRQGVNKTLRLVFMLDACILVATLFIARPLLCFILGESRTAVDAGYTYLCIRGLSMFLLTPAAVYKSVLPAISKPFFSTASGFLEVGVRFLFPLFLSQVLGFCVIPLTDTFTWLMLTVLLTVTYYYEFNKITKEVLVYE